MRIALDHRIISYGQWMPEHETSEDMEENEWMVCNFQGCGIHNISTVECEEAFPVKYMLGMKVQLFWHLNIM